MAEAFFYHLTTMSVQQALFSLLNSALGREWRVLLCFASNQELQDFSSLLWKNDPLIIHNKIGDVSCEFSPILLSDNSKNVNSADVCFFVGAANYDDIKDELKYKRLVTIFDSNISEQLNYARAQWLEFKKICTKLYYYKQEGRSWKLQQAWSPAE